MDFHRPRFQLRAIAPFLASIAFCLAGTAEAQSNPDLVGAIISGSNTYTPERLYSVYQAQLGTAIDATSVRAILSNIESFYLRDGYYKPELVARQLSGSGILRIEVYEAHLTDIRILGSAGPHAARVRTLADALRGQSALRSADLLAMLQQMRALPGLTVTATTQTDPNAKNGLILQLMLHYSAVSGGLQWTNRGTSEIGPNFLSGQIIANGVLGGREQFGLLLVSATQYDVYHGLGGFASTPIGHGTSVSLSGFRSDATPSISGLDSQLKYPHDLANLRVFQKLDDRSNNSVTVFTGFDYDDSLIRFAGQTLESDRARVALLGAGLDGRFGETASYSVSSSMRYGVDGLGAGVSVIDGSAIPNGYTVGTLSSLIGTRVDRSWSADLRISGQWSGNVLPYEERLKIGTETLGRAFTTATLAGDSGIGVQGQVHYRVLGLPAWIGVPSLFAYTDYGTVWQHDLALQQYAVTSGAGFALQVTRISGSIEVGKPVGFSLGVPHDFSLIGAVSVSF